MTISEDPSWRSGNRLLDALRRECPDLRRLGEFIDPAAGTELLAADRPMRHVYFPTHGALSTLVHTLSGSQADAFAVGSEGMVSPTVWLGVPRGPESIVLQTPGTIIQIRANDFCNALEPRRPVRTLLSHFTAYNLHCGYQNTVCHAHHSVEQRVCRWLLGGMDRARSARLQITQNLLGGILGVRRQSVGEVIGILQRAGLIHCRREEIVVRNRAAIEARACECHRLVRLLYRNVMEPLL